MIIQILLPSFFLFVCFFILTSLFFPAAQLLTHTLFFLVALSVLNGKSDSLTLLEQIIVNAAFVVCVWICENFLTHSNEGCKFVKYDNIELIKPERYDELKADLEDRLGLKIIRVEVGAVDFLTDMTMLRVFYLDSEKRIKSVDRQLKITPDQAFINP